VGLATADTVVEEGSGPAQLERILDALARVTFREDAPPPRAPIGSAASVLVCPERARAGMWADVYIAAPAEAAART